MDSEFKATYDLLYDKEEHLFFRDCNYFPEAQLEANGRKVFWGRGNGWVMGGLVSILQELPKNSTYRPFYEKLFVEMADKVAACQDVEGFWHASMLNHISYPNPETSSSAFFCYALAYGINEGLIDKRKIHACCYQIMEGFGESGLSRWKAQLGATYWRKPLECNSRYDRSLWCWGVSKGSYGSFETGSRRIEILIYKVYINN